MIILSPCIGVCTMNEEHKICFGCYRTRLEIIKWHSLTDDEKVDLIDLLTLRKEMFGEINA